MSHQKEKHVKHSKATPVAVQPEVATTAAGQLINDLKAACLEEFGPDIDRAVYPKKYFRDDIFTYKDDPEGPTRTLRAPRYCATDEGAAQVAAVLGATSTVRGNAMHYFPPPDPPDPNFDPAALGMGWKDTDTVPYLIFEKDGVQGQAINAAFLLDYFNHGYGEAYAMNSAKAEVEGSFA